MDDSCGDVFSICFLYDFTWDDRGVYVFDLISFLYKCPCFVFVYGIHDLVKMCTFFILCGGIGEERWEGEQNYFINPSYRGNREERLSWVVTKFGVSEDGSVRVFWRFWIFFDVRQKRRLSREGSKCFF